MRDSSIAHKDSRKGLRSVYHTNKEEMKAWSTSDASIFPVELYKALSRHRCIGDDVVNSSNIEYGGDSVVESFHVRYVQLVLDP